jgi:hypothetical protein
MIVSQRLAYSSNRALERIDLVADENGDRHGNLPGICNCHPSRLIDANASAMIEL